MTKQYPRCPKCGMEQNYPSGHTAARLKEQLQRLAEHERKAH